MQFSKGFAIGLATLAIGLVLRSQEIEAAPLPWMNTALAPEMRAASLISAMTLAQKFEQIVGHA